MDHTCRPDATDVIVRRESPATFTIAPHAGAPRLTCRTLGEALLRASAFALEQDVQLWYASDGDTLRPMPELAALRRVWAEYVEMPGLRLTPRQVQRLCGIEATAAAGVLATLVELGFLEEAPDGQYRRTTGGPVMPTLRMATASLRPRRPMGSRLRHTG